MRKSHQQHQGKSKWVRILIPVLLIVTWLAVAGIGGPYFGKISGVTSNEQSTFLPANAESTVVNKELKKFQSSSTLPALLVFNNNTNELDGATIAKIGEALKPLTSIQDAASLSPLLVSDDKKAALAVITMQSTGDYKAFTNAIRTKLDEAQLPVAFHISGPVGFLHDLGKAFSGIDGILLAVALSVVFIILIIVYRSPILPFIVLMTSLFALCAAILVVYYLAKADIITLNGQVQGILFILVIGAATDYALLFVARYREELLRQEEPFKALITSWKRSFEPIVAAGGTVIAGLLCLLLSDLSSNKALGPVGAIGITLAIISALTLLPSLLLVWGRKAFWPFAPTYSPLALQSKKTGLWQRVAEFVKKHSRTVWVATTVLLIVCSLGLTQLKADGVAQSEFVLGASSARDGQKVINDHFAGGLGTPAYSIVPAQHMQNAATRILKDSGVSSVAVQANNSPSGVLPLGVPVPPYLKAASPKEVDGEVLLEATLKDASDSEAAQQTIVRLRDSLHELDSAAKVGGISAVQLDGRTSAERDRLVIIPTVLVVITIILMVLLRSVLAPLLLLATTVLSFAATLGVSALVFNHLFGFPGADPSVVLFGFIFLVALGIDYNIFLMTRVREESIATNTKKGILVGLTATGSVITSAGVVLAATFAALGVIPILFLVQLAFIVAFGVLLDTIIVRSLLVPALGRDIGRRLWWPNKNIR